MTDENMSNSEAEKAAERETLFAQMTPEEQKFYRNLLGEPDPELQLKPNPEIIGFDEEPTQDDVVIPVQNYAPEAEEKHRRGFRKHHKDESVKEADSNSTGDEVIEPVEVPESITGEYIISTDGNEEVNSYDILQGIDNPTPAVDPEPAQEEYEETESFLLEPQEPAEAPRKRLPTRRPQAEQDGSQGRSEVSSEGYIPQHEIGETELEATPSNPRLESAKSIPVINRQANAGPAPKRLPTRPVTANPKAAKVQHGGYLSDADEKVNPLTGDTYADLGINSITSADLLKNDYHLYSRLDEKVVETKIWLQDLLTERDMTKDIAEARLFRGEKYHNMQQLIAQLLTRYFAQENQIRRQDVPTVIALVSNEMLGLGPIEPLWLDTNISEIMINGPHKVRVEIRGKLITVPGARFRDQNHLMEVCQQMLATVNKTIDVAHPYEDGRFPDQSRIHITHPAIGPAGPYVTIRRFPETVFSIRKMVRVGAMSEEIAEELGNLIAHGCSAVIAGGTGSGKSLSLNTLVSTPFGMTKMGDLKVGDLVLDENANPTKVMGYFPQPMNPCYEVTFSDGTKIIADQDHNWFTSTRSARRAVSRQETTPKILNAERKRMATDEELASLYSLYNNREDIISPRQIVDATPRLRTVIYNASRPLTSTLQKGRRTYYDSKELMSAVLVGAERVISDQRPRSAKESVVTTKEIFDTLRTSTGHANHAVRIISRAIPYQTRELIVSPYTFGSWLGDGYSTNGTICGIDNEIVDHIIMEGYVIAKDHSVIGYGRKTPLRVTEFAELKEQLNSLGVLKKKTSDGETKFIPDAYLYSSIEQRRAFIAGLLDTDGTVDKTTGVIEFSNSNKAIADGFRQIVNSLGYQSTIRSKIPTYMYKGEKKEGQLHYTVSFFANDDMFRLTRKNEIHRAIRKTKQAGHRSELRYIVDCQPVESVPTACITVDSPLSLYLVTDSFIPTHNTSMLNAFSGCIPNDERIITIEDNLELRLHPDKDVVALESRKSHQGDKGDVTIRELVKQTLRMRPDRIVVGEVRDGSAFDMLQAMSTGHDGSLTTVHANNSFAAVDRLTNLIASVGEIDSPRALSLIASGVDLFIVIERFEDGSRRIVEISEIPSRVNTEDGVTSLEPILLWEYVQTGFIVDEATGRELVQGEYVKRHDVSQSLVRAKRLDKRHHLSLEEIYALSKQPDDDK